jgi:2,5-diketo-D-gluconate reductase A
METIPRPGFGVWLIAPDATESAVARALAAGYRHVDTAAAYGNEPAVGRAVRAFGGEVHVTTKYFNPSDDHGSEDARAAFDESFARLGLERIDLYLVHWPVRAGEGFVASWRALVDLRDDARLGSIGVSNFTRSQLAAIVDATGVTPAVNQVELHPYFQQAELRREHAERGIATVAWGPLGQGDQHESSVLDDPVLAGIAAAHGRSVAQVVLRWHLQLGTIPIPKAADPDHIRENLDIAGFELTGADMDAIAALDRGSRYGPDPETYDFPGTYEGRSVGRA